MLEMKVKKAPVMSASLNILGILVVSERKNDGNRKSGVVPFSLFFMNQEGEVTCGFTHN